MNIANLRLEGLIYNRDRRAEPNKEDPCGLFYLAPRPAHRTSNYRQIYLAIVTGSVQRSVEKLACSFFKQAEKVKPLSSHQTFWSDYFYNPASGSKFIL